MLKRSNFWPAESRRIKVTLIQTRYQLQETYELRLCDGPNSGWAILDDRRWMRTRGRWLVNFALLSSERPKNTSSARR